ncbi:conserved Plasmodium protein, unknown function [Plasmodium knowlesi strain H]|uniref:Uncharacterized protein n=3 Tax=Plasmodium knowlesi TaxID=5850 RepID=A0A5K1VF43_PLAKH|nr:conserved Plasmodium protein, unknown function [Plasmodium knowlesi strain H]OTN67340.1 Uncharacterized protein PKNOH_S06424200 [Plasmodium knowlesi]CAA9987515.1 conserved Plasmodium protein, unknown function [Plasmodium knowlesi strain H]SBO23146.1 conserved Plasmodium protein, unknown function [Plasmodium knowlesi strain H]SBO23800.1 conserved Plasmodium protein, unknown function [Plasmodium knowlesi strain H]VVS76989.1 conserved Plasmodium protein, unknown function [Plasmodium knowlesi s|eukprot:XP_002258516.1 hypothetical protein, conserved in Plasmodium species [Plasmodium knowlesi strain H]
MRINKKDEIVNVLFTVFLLATQQICLLYGILNNSKSNNMYLLFLIVDIFLCVYIVLSLYDDNNAGVKISIQWMMYMITLSSKMGIFCFLIKNEKKNSNENSLLFTYLSNDVLVYNLLYLTPFIYLLFSLRSRNILENILNNKIVVENILSIDVNIINLFDLIDLVFMYSHLTNLYKILDHVKTIYSFQNVLIMLMVVLVDISLFGFYFPIYTNIDKSYSYNQQSVGVLKGDRPGEGGRSRDNKGTKQYGRKIKNSKIIKHKKLIHQSGSYAKYQTGERKKRNFFYATNGGSGSISIGRSGSTIIGRTTGGRSSMSRHSSAGSLLSQRSSRRGQSGSNSSVRSQRKATVINPTNVRTGGNGPFLDKSNMKYMTTSAPSKFFYPDNNTNMGLVDKMNPSSFVSNNSKESTYASSYMSKELLSREFSSSSFSSSSVNSSYLSSDGSNFGSSHSASSTSSSSYLPSLLSFSTSENKVKSNKSYHQKYKDIYTDVYITAKFHFIVGFLLVDVPFFIYRLLFCLKHKVMLTLIVKNVLFLLFRSYKLNEYRLVEKEKYKKNKSNLDFDFYNMFSVDSEASGYPKGDGAGKGKTGERHAHIHPHRHLQRGSRMNLHSFDRDANGQLAEDGAGAKSKRDRRGDRWVRKINKGKAKRGIKKEWEKTDKSRKKRKKKKKKNIVMQVFKEEYKENKKKLLLEKVALQEERGASRKGERTSRGSIPFAKIIDNNGEEYTEKRNGGEAPNGGDTNKKKKIRQVKFTWKERRQMKNQFRKFKNLIYKLKYKRKIPIYHFKIWDHIRAMCSFLFKRFGSSNFVYLDDKLVFSYFTNLKLMLLVLLNYVMKIGITIFFIFLLLNNHTRLSQDDFVYMYDMPVKPLKETPGWDRAGMLTFPQSFDLTKHTNLQLPKEPIPIYYINKEMEDNSKKLANHNYTPKGYIQLEMPDSLFNSTWENIFKVDKFYMYSCLIFFLLYFLLLLGTSTFFDILFGAILNTLSHLSFYFSLKQFVLFFFTFNGNVYNSDYVFHDGYIRKLNYEFEYLMLLLFNFHHFASLFKHASLFVRVLFNCRYIYYRRGLGRGRRNELRHSVSVYLLFLLCKYTHAPVNLNTLLFGQNILNNILLIDNINSFTWVNIIILTLFKGTQILMTKTNYFIIGLFVLHILLYVIYAIHAQILRYIILRKMEILFSFKNILISKYEEVPLVPDKTSPYVTCRDILKYYSEEGFFSSEGNMIPNFI